MMTADPLDWIDDSLAVLDRAHLRRDPAIRRGPQQPEQIRLDGRQLINFGSNDYLGLAAGALSEAALAAIRDAGWGSGASPLVTGRSELHADLELRLAAFEGTESALLFPSGFAANVGTIAALVGGRDTIFSDAKNHASILDGCRLSGAHVQSFPHRDVSRLRALLAESRGFRRRLIVTDSLFSMDGDLAPLADLAELARHHDAMLMVDEAHATGVFGYSGRGVCEHLQVEDGVQVRVGTLSKALGSVGGFVVGQRRLIEWLYNRARPYVFSTAPPAAMAAAAMRALEIVRTAPEQRVRLLDRAAALRERLQQRGWSTGSSASQIIPVYLGCPRKTTDMAGALREQGLLVPGIRPPTVPRGESLLRVSLSTAHTDAMVDQLLEGLITSAGSMSRG